MSVINLIIIVTVQQQDTITQSFKILRLKCTKFNFGAGELTALPIPLAGFKGPYF